MLPGRWDDWRPWLVGRVSELRTATAFLTRLPLMRVATVGGPTIAQAGWAFPLAGLLVGIIGAVVYALAHRYLALPPWPAAALAVAATLAATGALHEDGLADTIDGFGGGTTREQKLDIMRDSHIGVYGVCAVALSILIRVGAVASLADSGLAAAALLAAHGAARATLPAVMFLVPPARSDGLSFAAGQPPAIPALAAAVIGIVILIVCLGFGHAIEATITLAIVVALMARLSMAQIGGQSGDVLGAVEQVGEIAVLLVASR
jgi:adenosylcobinamide-GDP ribazoletransferase